MDPKPPIKRTGKKKRKPAPQAPPPPPPEGSPWRTWAIVAGVGIAGALLLAATQAPAAIEAAGKRGFDCLNTFYRTGAGTTAQCVDLAEGGLGWPSLVPGQSKAAGEATSRIHHYAAELDLLEASARHPDAAARLAAAERGIAAYDAAASRASLTESPSFDLAHSGAFAEAVRWSDRSGSLPDESSALGAAIAVADLDAVKRLAAKASPEKTTSSVDYDARRGAWLCLLGDPKAGVDALGLADATWREVIPAADEEFGWWKFRIGVVACGGKKGDLDFDPTAVSEFSELMVAPVRAADPAMAPAARGALFGPLLERWSGPTNVKERLPFVAMQLADVKDLEDLVARFADDVITSSPAVIRSPVGEELYSALYPSPWSLYPAPFADDALALRPVDALESGAARVEALLADAPEKMPERSGGQPAGESEVRLRAAPRERLAEYAAFLRLSAGVERFRRGQPDRARADLAKATGLPNATGLLAGARMAAGDAAGGLALLPASAPSDEDTARAYHIQKTLALASLGRFDDAYAEIKAAGDPTDHAAVAWLAGAMALQTGDKEPLIDTSGELEESRPSQSPLAAFVWWWKLIHMPEAERRIWRGKSGLTMWMFDLPPEVLPAVLRVVGEAAAGSGDVDVWLDYVFSGPTLQGPRVLPLARAEAARWRGDKAAAAAWDDRAKKLLGVIKDDRTAVLAGVAGL